MHGNTKKKNRDTIRLDIKKRGMHLFYVFLNKKGYSQPLMSC